MFKTTLTTVMGASAMLAAVFVFTADADAGGKRRGSAYSAGTVKMKTLDRRAASRLGLAGKSGARTQGADTPPPSRADLMAGFCNAAGGGASSNPDGTVSCVDPDGNDVLDPVPAPD